MAKARELSWRGAGSGPGEGCGCRSLNEWTACVGRVDRSDGDGAEVERAGLGRDGALKPSAAAPLSGGFDGTDRIEIGRTVVVMTCRIGRRLPTVGQGRRGACGRRSPGTERGPPRPALIEAEGRRSSPGRWRTRRRTRRSPGRARVRGFGRGPCWRGNRNDGCGGSRRAGRAAGTGG